MLTFAEIELLLMIALKLSPNSIKHISTKTGIKACTLYKWKTANVSLSPTKADLLMDYFVEQEPFILLVAQHVKNVLIKLLSASSLFSEEEVAKEE